MSTTTRLPRSRKHLPRPSHAGRRLSFGRLGRIGARAFRTAVRAWPASVAPPAFAVAMVFAALMAAMLAAGLASAAPKEHPPVVAPPIPVVSKPATQGLIQPQTTMVSTAPGAPVESLYVEGLLRVDSMTVVRKLGIRPGMRLEQEPLRQGLHDLYELGYFSDLEVTADTLSNGALALTLKVEERPTVGGVEFQGNKKIETSKLKTAVGLTVGQWVDEPALSADVAKLRDYYLNEGYANARIEARLVPPESRVPTVLFQIHEGEKLRIAAITFSGNRVYDEGILRKQISSHPHGFLRSGTYKPEQLDEDAGKVATYYRDHGYREVVVHTPTVDHDSSSSDIRVNFKVDEGPLEYFGFSRWSGDTAISDSILSRFLAYKPGSVYSEAAVRKTLETAYAAYQERGYIFANVDPQMALRDTAVDLQYQVSQGKLAHLHEIKVTGNTHTKEKVVRRQVLMRQGDVFRRSLVQRSQRDVFALGIFSNVDIDYQPVDEASPSGDVDLTFKVAEKQTGTASMGAGYSSQTGLTGFADLGHKNIFGGGQSVNLHLERGNNISNYELTYTEPYFRDTPTSVGFDLFNTFRNRTSTSLTSIATFYDEKRKGAAITVGRPLGFIDYARLSVTYRLEDVTLTNFEDSLALPGGLLYGPDSLKKPIYPDIDYLAKQHYPQRTSSVTLNFQRNSTNNPFYPTQGSQLLYRLGLTGGTLGGDVTFNKHLMDYRHYGHLFGPFTLMNRHRIGVLTGSDSASGVPLYERFRLGGTTEDYLRGYPDFEVVPAGNATTRGGKLAFTSSLEMQFLIADPVHAVLFMDAGNTWNDWKQFQAHPTLLRTSVGLGLRMEIPILGPVGFDYGYGFSRHQWVPHILFGGQF